jgi:hypothetical protein
MFVVIIGILSIVFTYMVLYPFINKSKKQRKSFRRRAIASSIYYGEYRKHKKRN